ncbi:hypothetical protein ACVMIH_005630 [Bradyrhizobium sp. USDA 4503]
MRMHLMVPSVATAQQVAANRFKFEWSDRMS